MIYITMPDGTKREFEKEIRVMQLLEDREDVNRIYAVTLNGKLHDVNYCIKQSGVLTFIYDTSETGKLIYDRTLNFLVIVAVKCVYHDAEVYIQHALSQGLYCTIDKLPFLCSKEVAKIKAKMHALIAEKKEIKRSVVSTNDAVAHFEAKGMKSKAMLLKCRKSASSSIYTLCGVDDYFYGIMLPDTSYITHFSIQYHAPGIWISANGQWEDQSKLFHVFQEFETWGRRIGVSNVAQLNEKIVEGEMDELVLMSEAMIEKKLAELAATIVTSHKNTKFILIAGPSSAGKTTFSRRLAIHLKILGKKPIAISMDDFYRNREDTPKLPDGSYDFEAIEAVDLELFNDVMLKLSHHEAVKLPSYNFKTGMREWRNEETQLEENQILIIEGIHGLNPKTSQCLADNAKYKIYINALTHLNLDAHNRIATSEYRLIRRIARDYQFRGRDAVTTIHFWKDVRQGEETYIYPYQNEADAIFNSSMVYELSVLKKIVIPLLDEVAMDKPEYLEANRLKKLLAYFVESTVEIVPRNSILAEFIGNSVFDL